MKQIAVVVFDKTAGEFHVQQLSYLLDNRVNVFSLDVNEVKAQGLKKADIYCITTDALSKLPDFQSNASALGEIVMMHIAFPHDVLQRLAQIPDSEKALIVNLNEPMAQEAMSDLIQLGAGHIHYIPFYPGADPDLARGVSYAITPDEVRYVPKEIPHVINVGQRQMDGHTLAEIALKLKMYDIWEDRRWKSHLASLASDSYNFDALFGRALMLESSFQSVLDIIDLGILGVNDLGDIFIWNKKAAQLADRNLSEAIGQKAERFFPEIPFAECRKNQRKIDARLIQIGEKPITVTLTPISYGAKNMGILAVLQHFAEEEERQHKVRSQLLSRGHTARYTFDDIISISPLMERTKKIAEKMAATRSSILITGESGTGKELFAQAIHNASDRKNDPFIALNCAALPENLLESELFGYTDGAFTGAKKGGKLGLFEFAHQGTLFLDEVEGMSPMLQVKLLRVIQEQQVMRLGDTRLISIDVRIIAATNRDLGKLVDEGRFREDLYYRLNTLPVNIPPLRERKEDILPLIYHFMKENHADYQLSEPVCQRLKSHSFRGNIRELKNYAEYFAFLDKDLILYEDLPPALLKEEIQTSPVYSECRISPAENNRYSPVNGANEKASLFVLEEISKASLSGISVSRETLSKQSHLHGINLSVYEVREIMKDLALQGYIVIPRGRRGSRITEKGVLILHSNRIGK